MSTVHTRTARGTVLALFTSLAMIAAGVLGLTLASPASATPSGKIRICHATASTTNPYTSPTVDMSSIDEANNANHNGHGDHTGPVFDGVMTSGWGDIIPPFTYTYVQKGRQGQPDTTVTVNYAGLNWTVAGQAIYYNGCGFPPKPDTTYRTVYWCDAQGVRQSQDQSSTDSGATWTPSAPADATTDSTLKCSTTPIERTMYWCDAEDVLQSQVQASIDEGVTWTPEVPADAVEDDTLTCGGPQPITRTMYWCDAEDVLQSQVQASIDEGVTWTPEVPADAVEDDTLTCGGPQPITRTMYWCDADDVRQSEVQRSTDEGVTWTPEVPADAVENDALTCGTTPDPDPESKPEVITYRDSATLSATEDICTVNGTVTVDVRGTGLGQSTVSQADAAKVAEGNARLDLEYNLKMAKAQFPGATQGACAPVTPPVVEPAVVGPAVVAVPGRATVSEVPARVPVPAAVTLPASVPAGGGSSTPGLPAWAVLLLIAGGLGAVVTGARVMRATK